VFFISCHYATWVPSILSISYHYSTYLSALFFHIISLFNLLFFRIFHIFSLFKPFCPIFSSPGPKIRVNYCHHLASVVCRLLSVVCTLFTFQASSPRPLGQLEPNLAGMILAWSSTKFLFFVPVGYSTWLPGPIICCDWLKFQRSSLKLVNDHWNVLY
jgi:hypothetical protein